MFTNQSEDSERCESMELDNKIRDLIESSASSDPRGVTTGAAPSHRSSGPLQTPGNTASTACAAQGTSRMSAAEGSTEHTECTKSSRGKNSANSLEQKIRCLEKQRKELLEVNQQWDQQFRSMRELYARKVAELKTQLDATRRLLSALEEQQPPDQGASGGPSDLRQGRRQRQEKEKESLNEELYELKKENKLLKETNALVNRKKEHYECEIKRLNKALWDALAIKSSLPEGRLGKAEEECSHEELRTEMEVLKHQVQIYEEDFKRERSDRERLNQEKEELQQINQTSQSQLNKLKSKIKACQMEKEKLEKQLKQMHLPTCSCGLDFHLWDAGVPGVPTRPGAVRDLRKFPPDHQWCTPDQLPPDVQHTADGKKLCEGRNARVSSWLLSLLQSQSEHPFWAWK